MMCFIKLPGDDLISEKKLFYRDDKEIFYFNEMKQNIWAACWHFARCNFWKNWSTCLDFI